MFKMKYRKLVRNIIIHVFGTLRRCLFWKGGGRIIAFHDIDDIDVFYKKMKWLQDHYDIVPLEKLLDNPDSKQRQVAITFDDGFACWYWNAVPVLEELNIPAVFFVCSGAVNDAGNKNFIRKNLHRTKDLQPISIDQLRYISKNALFEIGGHTLSHIDLGLNLSSERLTIEINEDMRRIERWTGVKPRWFAYPYGRYKNISYSSLEYLRDSSYKGAFTIQPGFVVSGHDKFLVHRDSLNIHDTNRLWKDWLSGGYW